MMKLDIRVVGSRGDLRATSATPTWEALARLGAAAALALVALLGASPTRAVLHAASPPPDSVSARSGLKRIAYADSELSLNEQCPVRHGGLNPNIAAVYVNGHPVGFC